MPTVQRDGVRLYYESDDAGSTGPPVVFVQGLGVGRWSWQWQREAFEEFDLLFPDNRGTGNSEAALPPIIPRLPRPLRLLLFTKLAGYSTEGLAADLEAILADAGVDEAHVVGASLGGMIAQQYVLDYDRAVSLSLLCTTHGGEEALPIPDETVEQMFSVPDGADERETIRHRMAPAIGEEFVENNPETVEQIIDWRLEQDAGEVARESQGAAGVNFDVSERVHEIDLPTLILHGTDDRVLPVENSELLAEKIPNNRFETIDGGSHLFMIEDSKQVNSILREFLESV
ncbi:alpha/beta fold hydrolase [Halovenus sp. HT40]|uniref:alpha/beta fold hydrolase n=1 Tax=Halovenus sp. HT40 TaxID=3126691 RepID=UPI00300F35B8